MHWIGIMVNIDVGTAGHSAETNITPLPSLFRKGTTAWGRSSNRLPIHAMTRDPEIWIL